MLPGSNWQTLHTNELAQSVFDTLLPCANKTLDNSVPAWPQARYPFFYYLNLVAESFSAMKEALKTKLKISKEDLKIFESINFCLSQKFAIYEWVLEIEDNPMHLLTLEYLVKAKRQSQYFFENIKSKLKDSPVKIVNGHDLVGRIPGIEMANVLKKIRLLQLEQPGLEKESLIKKVISKE